MTHDHADPESRSATPTLRAAFEPYLTEARNCACAVCRAVGDRRRGETACRACKAAMTAVRAAQRPKTGKRRPVAECNTIAGYHAHNRRGEKACDPCAQVHRTYQREWRAAKVARLKAAAQVPA